MLTCAIKKLLPCFEPRALPNVSTSPLSIAITGFIFNTFPKKAALLDILPPFLRYSRVSRSATRRMRFFAEFNSSAIAVADSPSLISFKAYSIRICSPTVTFSLSIIYIFPWLPACSLS